MRHITRGGRYARVADPGWRDPLSGQHARRSGGRWNPPASFVDAVTDRGLASLGLPASYPVDPDGSPISHAVCQPLGQLAWDDGEPGIACRSAATTAPAGGEGLTYFARRPLRVKGTERFADWYWSDE